MQDEQGHEVVPRVAVAAHLERAELFRDLGRPADVDRELRRAREVEPLGPTCLVRATWLARSGRLDEAIVELEGLLAVGTLNLEPRLFVNACRRLVQLLREAGRVHEAERTLQRAAAVACEHDLMDASLLVTVSGSAAYAGDIDTDDRPARESPTPAERLLLGAVRLAENEAELAAALSELGRFRLANRRFSSALPLLWRAYRLAVSAREEELAAGTLVLLGDLCWERGRTRLAFRAWRNAVIRLDRLGSTRGTEDVWRRLDEATRIVEVRERNPDAN